MAKDKNSFVLYANYIDVINALSNEQAGILIKHIFEYVNDKEPAEPIDPVVNIAWVGIKRQLKEDLKKYEQKRKQLQANVNKRYQKDTNEEKELQMNTNEYKCNQIDGVNVNVNVNVNDNVNDIDKVDNNIIDNNKEKNKNACTPEFISMLLNIVKSKLPEMEDSTYISLEIFLKTLSKSYSQKNIEVSLQHALLRVLENYSTIENTFGYLRNAIAINCEQFKEGSYHYDNK